MKLLFNIIGVSSHVKIDSIHRTLFSFVRMRCNITPPPPHTHTHIYIYMKSLKFIAMNSPISIENNNNNKTNNNLFYL